MAAVESTSTTNGGGTLLLAIAPISDLTFHGIWKKKYGSRYNRLFWRIRETLITSQVGLNEEKPIFCMHWDAPVQESN